jgi:serine/threonine protein kinase
MNTSNTSPEPFTEDPDIPVGCLLLDRYRVLREVGRGGMGVVFLCRDLVAEIDVAIKTLPPKYEQPRHVEEFRETFIRTQGLHHPHIAALKTLEQDRENETVFLVMEFIDGDTLRSLMKKDNFAGEKDEVIEIVKQLADGLHHGHVQGIVHRDIKPSNVMRTKEGVYKLLDYGVSADIRETMMGEPVLVNDVTGTPEYMSPEQWRGETQDARTDQYALAVLACELLSGGPPFRSDSLKTLSMAVREVAPKRPEAIAAPVWRVILRGLDKKPEKRFPSCIEFSKELSLAMRGKETKMVGIPLKVFFMGGLFVLASLLFWKNLQNPDGFILSIRKDNPVAVPPSENGFTTSALSATPAIAFVPLDSGSENVWTRECISLLWHKLKERPDLAPLVSQKSVDMAMASAGLAHADMASVALLKGVFGSFATQVIGLKCIPGEVSVVESGGESYTTRYLFRKFHLTVSLIDFSTSLQKNFKITENLCVQIQRFRNDYLSNEIKISEVELREKLIELLLPELEAWTSQLYSENTLEKNEGT